MWYRSCLIILLLACSVSASFAQQDKVVIRFVDADNDAPMGRVAVMDRNGTILANSDKAGYVTLPFSVFRSGTYLLAMAAGYRPDTLRSPVTAVYMTPLAVQMNAEVIHSKRVNKLLESPYEYVVDYDFIGDQVLVASYSGDNGRKAKLFLLNKKGDVLTSCRVPDEPQSLFRSCVGNYYCVCTDKFYPITIESGKITFLKPYPINLLEGLQQCEQSVGGNLYYRIGNRLYFSMVYGMIAKGDSVFKPIAKFEEDDVAIASYNEWIDIQVLLASGQRREAARKQLARLKWDRGSYAHINMPLFIADDRLAIFDFFKKRIMFYDLAGRATDSTDIHFEWRQSQLFEILKDGVTGQFYIHRYNKENVQTLEVLNMSTGDVSGKKVQLDYPFAQQVKVHDGDIYFLWQGQGGGVRQIFVQHMN